MGGKNDFLLTAVLIAAAFLLYANSLENSFVWDDEALVLGNPAIRSLEGVPRLFTARLFPEIPGGNFYRPVQSLSYAVDYSLWRLDPFGYHLTNILIHAGNAVLVYLLLLVLTGRRDISFMAALLFAVHPAATEAVDYVSGRADLLAAFFLYVSLLCSVARERLFTRQDGYGAARVFLFLAAVLSFVLALLAKEATVVLPLLLLLCTFCFGVTRAGTETTPPGRRWGLYGTLFIAAAVYLCIRTAMFLGSTGAVSSNPYPFYERFLSSFKVILLYLKLLVFPFPLSMERVVPMETSFFSPAVFLPLLFLCAVAAAAVKAYRVSKAAFFGIAWFFIALLPYMNWFPLNAEMAEHWVYVPSVGFFLLAALGVARLHRSMPPRLAYSIFALVLVCLSFLTVRRNLDWRDNETIYTQTARYSPGSPRARYNLGNIYMEKGRFREAIEEYRASIRLKAGDARTRRNLGKALLGLGRPREAIGEFKAAVSLDPSSPESHTSLGAAYGMAGLHEEAIRELEMVVRFEPGSADAHNNLASVYTNTGRFEDALAEYEKALAIDPGMVEATFNLGIVYYNLGRPEDARDQFEKVLRLDPGFSPALMWSEKIGRSPGKPAAK